MVINFSLPITSGWGPKLQCSGIHQLKYIQRVSHRQHLSSITLTDKSGLSKKQDMYVLPNYSLLDASCMNFLFLFLLVFHNNLIILFLKVLDRANLLFMKVAEKLEEFNSLLSTESTFSAHAEDFSEVTKLLTKEKAEFEVIILIYMFTFFMC